MCPRGQPPPDRRACGTDGCDNRLSLNNEGGYCSACNRTRSYADRRALVDAAKDQPCMDCGVYYPPHVMDLDHRPGEEKVRDVSQMMPVGRFTGEEIIAEIQKCDVVCTNCHRERTHQRRRARRGATDRGAVASAGVPFTMETRIA